MDDPLPADVAVDVAVDVGGGTSKPRQGPGATVSKKRVARPPRPYGLLAALMAAIAILLFATNAHEPIGHWLFWPYALLWLVAILWALSCLSVGHAALSILPRLGLPLRERILFDFATGVLLFALGVCFVGLCSLLRGPFFWFFPVFLGALGARGLFTYVRRALEHFVAARKRARTRPSVLHGMSLMLGALGLTLVYLGIMTPENVSFDAATYHLGIAEQYASAGGITSYPEGWFAGAVPHLASWLYTWAFTVRPFGLFMRIELAAHLEFMLFLATLAMTPVLVEALCPRRRAGWAWTFYFLFPGLFLYDSNLSLSADHVLAFWAVPLVLAARRAAASFQPGRCALLGLMMAGAALTKYQSLSLLAPVAVLVLAGAASCLFRDRAAGVRRATAGLGIVLAVFGAATAPHWLANLVWYGNPVYPLLGNVFASHPWVSGWRGPVLDTGWQPTGTLGARLLETTIAVFTFSFAPHDWSAFHRDVPVFGFLFTLSLLVLPFIRGGRRIWLLASATSLGVFVWYWTFHQDRYLQALLPWMVATASATLARAWSAHFGARLAVSVLVGLQLIWGGDVPFLPTHAMIHDVPLKRTIDLLSTTFRGESESRYRTHTSYEEIASYLPRDATVLLHEEYLRLGLERRIVADSQRWQGGIDYAFLGDPAHVYDKLESYGVTHVIWNTSQSINQEIHPSGELVFYDFVLNEGLRRRDFGPHAVVEMPGTRPVSRHLAEVVYYGCRAKGRVLLAEIDSLVSGDGPEPCAPMTDSEEAVERSVAETGFVVVDDRSSYGTSGAFERGFVSAPRWGHLRLWIRRRSRAAAAAAP